MKNKGNGVLVISNLGLGDDTFDSDVGSWNVTRAKRDCAAGKHKVYEFDVLSALPNVEKVEVNQTKIDSMAADRDRLAKSPPSIFIVERGALWFIDGHHRLRALAKLGETKFAAYVIEEEDSAPYKVFYNGDRVAPWYKT